MKFLLILFVTFCVVCVVVTDSNLTNKSQKDPNGQIAGRTIAGSVPYQVSFRDDETNQHVCSGSIINERWILTAAQCFDGLLADSRYIKVGSNQLDGADDTRYDILQALVHPDFNIANNVFDYALVQTTGKISFNQAVKPIALATFFGTPLPGSTGTFTGWRVSDEGSNELQSIKLKVVLDTRCSLLAQLGMYQLCTQNTEAGTCAGDTGGPLLVNGKQVGVSSSKLPCVRDQGSLFSNTARMNQWIRDNTPV